MDRLRKFLAGRAGRGVGVVLAAVALAAMALVLRGTLRGSDAAIASRDRMFICAATGKPFEYELKRGDVIPVPSPHSGSGTGYPAEACFWTADGKTKAEPTLVLLNQHAGKPGPTFCPDCGRLVVALNPPPERGMTPPVHKDQYKPTTERRR